MKAIPSPTAWNTASNVLKRSWKESSKANNGSHLIDDAQEDGGSISKSKQGMVKSAYNKVDSPICAKWNPEYSAPEPIFCTPAQKRSSMQSWFRCRKWLEKESATQNELHRHKETDNCDSSRLANLNYLSIYWRAGYKTLSVPTLYTAFAPNSNIHSEHTNPPHRRHLYAKERTDRISSQRVLGRTCQKSA